MRIVALCLALVGLAAVLGSGYLVDPRLALTEAGVVLLWLARAAVREALLRGARSRS